MGTLGSECQPGPAVLAWRRGLVAKLDLEGWAGLARGWGRGHQSSRQDTGIQKADPGFSGPAS